MEKNEKFINKWIYVIKNGNPVPILRFEHKKEEDLQYIEVMNATNEVINKLYTQKDIIEFFQVMSQEITDLIFAVKSMEITNEFLKNEKDIH